jgi:hypothetical protein
MVGAESPETPSGELRTLSAADTDFQKVATALGGTLWVLGFGQRRPDARFVSSGSRVSGRLA